MEPEIRQVEQHYLAAVREHTTSQKLATTIRELLTENAVYTFLNAAGIQEHSHNVFVYWNEANLSGRPADPGIVLEVAVQVFAPFTGNDRVICSSTPAGRAATLLHRGPYEQLGIAHSAIIDWCRANHHPITGLRWEIYGRWNNDPDKLETQVFYLLQ
ncbi:MAG TPA: GyrI-like domain-containing protein [Phototrophicaceae bacterium]|nr:GyrI-like domain-containing protein [Phototrophicaceae bacterium]